MSFTELAFDANWTLLKSLLWEKMFLVPDYQRDYSWKKKNVEQLINDLLESSDRGVSHFVWSIVLFWKKTDSQLEIIDWQQRLITITLILSVIKSILNEYLWKTLVKEEIDRINTLKNTVEFYLSRNSRDGDRQVVKISRTSNALLENITKLKFTSSEKKEEKNMIENFNSVKRIFNSKLEWYQKIELKLTWLNNLIQAIEWISIIPIYVINLVEAYTIFEVLNDRWLSLTVADLLKNLLFKQASWSDKEIIKKIWEQIQTRMEDNKIDVSQFIRHFWLSEISFVREKDLYDKLKDVIKSYTSDDIKDFWNKLLINSLYYRINYEPNLVDFNELHWDWKRLYIILKNIRDFRVKQIYPIILALYRKYKDESITIKQLLDFLRYLEKATFIFIMSDLSPSLIEWIYSTYARKIAWIADFSNINNEMDSLKKELNKHLSLVDLDSLFSNLVYDSDNNSKNKAINYVLQQIELINNNELIIINSTIEHIYPKDPKKNKDWLKNELINWLWNLTLLSDEDNNLLGNNDNFKSKQLVYKASKINMTSELVSYETWWKEEIDERYKKLLKEFNMVFSV